MAPSTSPLKVVLHAFPCPLQGPPVMLVGSSSLVAHQNMEYLWGSKVLRPGVAAGSAPPWPWSWIKQPWEVKSRHGITRYVGQVKSRHGITLYVGHVESRITPELLQNCSRITPELHQNYTRIVMWVHQKCVEVVACF